MSEVIKQVEAERERQDAKWGGPEHDDEHQCHEWVRFVREHLDEARHAAGKVHTFEDWRREMIQIAALAVAAVESYDRKRRR